MPPSRLPSRSVTNSEFLTALFPDLPEKRCAWVCTFPGDPGAGEGPRARWAGFGLQGADFTTADHLVKPGQTINTFCTASAFRGEDDPYGPGHFFPGRRNALFGGMYALMLDDLGTGPGAKLPLDEHLAKLPPSWILETSPGNHQVGYLINGVVESRELAAAIIDAMIYRGLLADDDPGMSGVTRFLRMPVGWNGKAKYGPGGFHHRLLHWDPGARYAPRQITNAFGIDWREDVEARVSGTGRGSARVGGASPHVLPAEEAWIGLLARAVGRFEAPQDKGADGVWHDCTCPWVHEHTDGADNGSAYCAGSGGGFECHHGHCRERTWRDVRRWLLEHEDPEIASAALTLAAREAFGLELLDAPEAPVPAAPVPTFQQARMLTSRLTRETPPGDLDALLEKIASWVIDGRLTKVEVSTLRHDIVDATRLGKGDVTEGLKDALVQQRRRRNVESNQKSLIAKIGEKACPALPLVPPASFPITIGDSDTPALVSRNVEYLLRTAGVSLAYNEMKQRKEYGGPFRGWSLDWAANWLKDACTLNGLVGANEVNLKRTTDRIAEEHSYHPFLRWLDSIEWDGVSRLQSLFSTIHVAPDKTRLRDLILQRWLCSAIAAARHLHADEPGLQPRGLVIFTGEQRAGKSTWFARLFRGLFPGSNACFVGNAHYSGDKDSKLLNLRSLVVEWGELESTFGRAEIGAIKAFVNQNVDSLRKPFAPEVTDIPRRSVYCATVNRKEFLRDTTGNSRFWAVPPVKIDLDAQRALDMAQIWAEVDRIVLVETSEAEARGSYRRPWLMSGEETDYIETHNSGHRDRSDMEIWLQELFRWDDPAWSGAKPHQRTAVNPMRLGDIAGLLGINRRGYGRNLSELKSALRELTGQQDGKRTTKNVAGVRVSGKFWSMPPLADVPSDAPPAPQENFSHIGGRAH